MKRRELVALLVCAVAVWPLKGLLMALALASPAFAQTPRDDGASIAAEAKDAATQLQAYLAGVLKGGGRPDFSKPPASDLLAQVFNLKQLEALPPAQGDDLLWLMDWFDASNGVYKSIMFFGISPPINPLTDEAALQRNFTEYEDQLAAASDFMLRSMAREIPAALAFLDKLPPAQRTPVRMEGFNKMRVAEAEMVRTYLGCIVPGMKPANARLVSAALRDTGAVIATTVLPADQPTILTMLDKAQAAATDEETRSNLSAFGSLMAKAK
ncbi:MAG TPA: hypothetical protein VGR70_14695 [Stellaceae bacterium]|nr:hypothetical protein [Stellaceae bacterium]